MEVIDLHVLLGQGPGSDASIKKVDYLKDFRDLVMDFGIRCLRSGNKGTLSSTCDTVGSIEIKNNRLVDPMQRCLGYSRCSLLRFVLDTRATALCSDRLLLLWLLQAKIMLEKIIWRSRVWGARWFSKNYIQARGSQWTGAGREAMVLALKFRWCGVEDMGKSLESLWERGCI